MGVPQVIWCCLASTGFALSCAMAGKKATIEPFSYVLRVGMTALLLWWGGFFG